MSDATTSKLHQDALNTALNQAVADDAARSKITPASLPPARSPRLLMLANGKEIKGAFSVEAVSNNHYQADTASGEIALGADTNFGMSWWDAQTDITLEIKMAVPTAGSDTPSWQSVIVATVDHLQFDITTNCVRFNARDLTARLIETKTQQTYANRTSSEIAQIIAASHKDGSGNPMQAVVTPTKTIVGQYYQLEHDRITMDNFSHQTTEWDLLTYLAQQEGYDVWVQGNTLYFKPPGSSSTKPYQLVYTPATNSVYCPTVNAERVTMERSLTLAKDIQVTVKSTNLRDGKAYIRTVRAQGAKSSGQANTNTQAYVFTKPGLSPDQALKYAQQKLAELSKHERVINIEMPGELTLTPRDMVQLSGTGSGFDLTYFIDEITRSLDFESGFTQHIRCKNSSPRTQTTVL